MIRKWEFVRGFKDYMVTDQGEVFRQSKLKDTKGSVYRIVSLSKFGKKLTVTVHRLVLEAFVGARPEGYVAHHKDGNRTNNILSNLEWVTRSHHCRMHPRSTLIDRYGESRKRIGGRKNACGVTCDNPWRGERVHSAKLTESKVKLVRMLRKFKWLGFDTEGLAEIFNVSQGTISKIVNYRLWAHVI